jgi:hypothetical protein
LQNTLEWQLGWPIIKGSSEIVDTTIGNILRNSFGTWGNVLWTHWEHKKPGRANCLLMETPCSSGGYPTRKVHLDFQLEITGMTLYNWRFSGGS